MTRTVPGVPTTSRPTRRVPGGTRPPASPDTRATTTSPAAAVSPTTSDGEREEGPTMIQDEQARWFAETFDALVRNVEQAILGKTDAVRLAVTCLLSEGHLLLEDVPGT